MSITFRFPVTASALNEAEQYAQSYLRPAETSASSTRVVEHHHYHNSYTPWFFPWGGWGQTTIINTGGGAVCRREEDSHVGMILLGIAATGIALAASYFLGKDYATWNNASRDIQELNEKHFQVNQELRRETYPTECVFRRERYMLEVVRNDARTGMITKLALLVATVATAVGAFFTIPELLAIGVVGGIGAGIVMMFRWGFIDTDKTVTGEAQKLLSDVQTARNTLRTF